ncbi:hypothetical protein KKH81_00940 [Patescibacteria group bacterium]|nr:hypothetical protein [Patescibacteria group bacterium]
MICSTCGKTFDQNQHPEITYLGTVLGRNSENERCYNCALTYVSGGFGPEGGDFNSARFISGEMSDDELRWFQEDQRDLQRRYPEESDEERYPERYEYYDYEPEPEELYLEDETNVCEYLCVACGTPVGGSDRLCDSCDARYSTSHCVCCQSVVPDDSVICVDCDEQFARERLEYVLSFRILSGYWWRDLRDFLKSDAIYWLKRLRR